MQMYMFLIKLVELLYNLTTFSLATEEVPTWGTSTRGLDLLIYNMRRNSPARIDKKWKFPLAVLAAVSHTHLLH